MVDINLIKQNQSLWICVLILVLLMSSGCAITPSTSAYQPYTLRPPQHAVAVAQPSGAIFQTIHSTGGVRYTPLFEDRRARSVGDTLIVTLNETTNASKSSGSNVDRSGEIGFSVQVF